MLCPQQDTRHTPIEGIVLTDAEMDHTLGLFSLRETHFHRLYAAEWVYNALTQRDGLLGTLSAYCLLGWQQMHLDVSIALRHRDGQESGLHCQAIPTLSSKTVAYAGEQIAHPESVVGYRISDTHSEQALIYMPGVQELNRAVRDQLQHCACLMIDGTCWSDDELTCAGIGEKTARSMGHLPIGETDGSLEQLASLPIERVIYIHINNTNPILIENSPQRHTVEERDIAIAFDGMEMEI